MMFHHPQQPDPDLGALSPGSHYIELAVGQNNYYPPAPASLTDQGPPARPRADVGVITILSQEMDAVVRVFERAAAYRSRQLYGGTQAHEAQFAVPGGVVRAVAIQALDRGPRSAAAAYQRLRQHYEPPIVLLVGIAGAIRPLVRIGDVVISDEVVYYDARRESPQGVHRRGQAHPIAPVLRHRLHEFFRVHGSFFRGEGGYFRGRSAARLGPANPPPASQATYPRDTSFRVHHGPIGSGDVVVTNEASEIRRWVRDFNEKTLAVETEAGGVAQAFYEEVHHDTALRGWLTIRGISDGADADKGTSYHDLAAERAALVLEGVLPFLLLTGTDE